MYPTGYHKTQTPVNPLQKPRHTLTITLYTKLFFLHYFARIIAPLKTIVPFEHNRFLATTDTTRYSCSENRPAHLESVHM